MLFSATVVTANFASMAVDWSLSAVDGESVDIDPEDLDASISPEGMLYVGPDCETGTVITVTATSVFDSTKTDTAEVTVA